MSALDLIWRPIIAGILSRQLAEPTHWMETMKISARVVANDTGIGATACIITKDGSSLFIGGIDMEQAKDQVEIELIKMGHPPTDDENPCPYVYHGQCKFCGSPGIDCEALQYLLSNTPTKKAP